MEPITTAWMMTTLLSGWIGNRGDYWLCKGANGLYNRIKSNLNEPANHDIQRAVRKSYLKATLMAVDHIQKQRSRFSLTDTSWRNLYELKSYINDQVINNNKEVSFMRSSDLDNMHQEILFPKEGDDIDRMPELVQNLKDSIIHELEGGKRRVESALKDCINHGWQEGTRNIDFYKLTCAFFTQELKDNPQLSTYIQTEYLDKISTHITDMSIQLSQLMATLDPIYREYKEVLPKLEEILSAIEELRQGQQIIMDELPEKTANLVLDKINTGAIIPKQISISTDYQNYIHEIDTLNTQISDLKLQIDVVDKAIAQVDEGTKFLLHKNKQNFETQIIQLSTNKEAKENELDSFVSNVLQLAQQLEHSKSLHSERLQKARELFEKGKYRELDNVLNEADIDRDFAQFDEKRKIWASEYTIKAQTAVLIKDIGWFEKADELYAKALRVIENLDTTFNYAYFLAEHNEILRSADLYESALKYISDDDQRAATLNNLAVLQRDKNEFEEAEKSYQEALEIRRKLAAVNPQTYLPDVGMTLNNLANLQRAKNEFEEAEKSYQEALEIYRKLAAVNPQTYLPDVGMTLNNLANLQSDKNEFEEAEKSYQEALEIRRKLAAVYPQTYLPNVAGTLNNLAVLQRAKNEFEEAEKSYQEALEIYRKLATVNPQTYLPDVGMTLNNLAVLQRAKNEFEEAERSYQEALEIRRKLAHDHPHVYSIYYADTALNLSIFYTYSSVNMDKAIIYSKEAIKWYSPFVDIVPHAKKHYQHAEQILEHWKSKS